MSSASLPSRASPLHLPLKGRKGAAYQRSRDGSGRVAQARAVGARVPIWFRTSVCTLSLAWALSVCIILYLSIADSTGRCDKPALWTGVTPAPAGGAIERKPNKGDRKEQTRDENVTGVAESGEGSLLPRKVVSDENATGVVGSGPGRLLPRKVVSVFGTESSGSTFLASALGAAVGAVDDGQLVFRQAASPDGEWEVQHLSLPWGFVCERGGRNDIHVVEALVPGDVCFRYELLPDMESSKVEKMIYRERVTRKKSWDRIISEYEGAKHRGGRLAEEEEQARSICRDELRLSDKTDGWTCGAKCGAGEHDGFALYPLRFFVNITSHIEWYLSRGVDIRVVISARDRTISGQAKLYGHCQVGDASKREDDVASGLMEEALRTYGGGGSQRVIPVSYEGLMGMRESYLFSLYGVLGINSTYVPSFVDGNKKYVLKAARP